MLIIYWIWVIPWWAKKINTWVLYLQYQYLDNKWEDLEKKAYSDEVQTGLEKIWEE